MDIVVQLPTIVVVPAAFSVERFRRRTIVFHEEEAIVSRVSVLE